MAISFYGLPYAPGKIEISRKPPERFVKTDYSIKFDKLYKNNSLIINFLIGIKDFKRQKKTKEFLTFYKKIYEQRVQKL